MHFSNADNAAVDLDKFNPEFVKRELLDEEENEACTVEIAGYRCWGLMQSGTGCTNPDCPRNGHGGFG